MPQIANPLISTNNHYTFVVGKDKTAMNWHIEQQYQTKFNPKRLINIRYELNLFLVDRCHSEFAPMVNSE